jgi:hypothetical protein
VAGVAESVSSDIVLVQWDHLVLADLPPEAADVCWYGLRAWIEQGFKKIKHGGWQWQYIRMDNPVHAERLWLTITIAT